MEKVTMKNLVQCCMCCKQYDISNTFMPSICFRQNIEKAHRICSHCWWEPETGFARENNTHKCPGCIAKMPYNCVVRWVLNETIDLTTE